MCTAAAHHHLEEPGEATEVLLELQVLLPQGVLSLDELLVLDQRPHVSSCKWIMLSVDAISIPCISEPLT